jgi:outer membrane protein TolC
MKKNILFKSVIGASLVWLLSHPSEAQSTVLSLDDAIEQGIKANFNVQIAQKNEEITTLQIYKGNAGMLPTILANAAFGSSFNYVNQSFFDGREINRFGRQYSPSANVALSWTLYNGKLMQANFAALQTQGQQAKQQTQLVVQNTISQIMSTYFDILRQKQSVEFLQTIIKYYDERLLITEQRWQIGRASKLDYLQSKTDLTTQLLELTQAKNLLASAKIRLNTLLNRDTTLDFDVRDVPSFRSDYPINQLIEQAKTSNPELLILQKSIELGSIAEKQALSFTLPRLSLNSSFAYSSTNNNAGLFILNQSTGLNTGLTLSWSIFDGQRIRRNIETAKLRTELAKEQKASVFNQILGDLSTTYNQFKADQELLAIEEENRALAEENLTISLEKYRLGSSTILELSDAQRRFDTSLNRLVNARYNVKISELELLRLSGELIK